VFAASAALGLFALFSSVLTVSLIRGTDAPCFCFGAEQMERVSLAALLRAGLLLTLSGLAALIAFGDNGDSLRRADIAPGVTDRVVSI
jgi:hypothetical protein